MSNEAYLPCFKCGKTLPNVFIESDNQPYGGTEFRTEGHYGSTFWDSFDGEDLILNVCDDCLLAHSERLGQQKMYQPVKVDGLGGFGRKPVDRPIVAYTGNPDDSTFDIDLEDLGCDDLGIEWSADIHTIKQELKAHDYS